MARKFARTTTVFKEELGTNVWFNIGDECPEWAEAVITNTKVFEPMGEEGGGEKRYEELTVPVLMGLAKDRGVELTGTHKAEIIAALVAADAVEGEEWETVQ